eukprot:TRINITY_DN7207_c5_g1_i1.p1 TRINITY_DN7207_c5_g1~~TRINITY_DN7207_c5_g1_i1.p1  ORF type:complete len:149 (-),score=25.17 TRINITY_DN7207_c5_g1_i1:62-508(-)
MDDHGSLVISQADRLKFDLLNLLKHHKVQVTQLEDENRALKQSLKEGFVYNDRSQVSDAEDEDITHGEATSISKLPSLLGNVSLSILQIPTGDSNEGVVADKASTAAPSSSFLVGTTMNYHEELWANFTTRLRKRAYGQFRQFFSNDN